MLVHGESMTQQATLKTIYHLWWPLAMTWLMMAVEGPYLAAIIARMGESATNLAAYGVAYAFGLITEAPVIMLLSASTRLARGRCDYLRLRSFSVALCGLVTMFLLLLLVPPVFTPLTTTLLGLSSEVAAHVNQALWLLLPWPAAIGMRRFYQGVLIAHYQPGRVAVGTGVRLLCMSLTAFTLWSLDSLPGASLGACSLSAGVVAEALATRWLARRAIKASLGETGADVAMTSYAALSRFYLPLAMTPLIGLSVHPVVTFFLGHSYKPLESLAIMPVLYALTFLFRALGLSYPEVAIATLKDGQQNRVVVRKFAIYLGLALGGGLSLIAFTPLNVIWFATLSGLTVELVQLAIPPLQILALFPALTVAIGYQRAILIDAGRTLPVTLATAVEAVGIFSILALLVLYSTLPGVTSAALAYLLGRIMALLYLCWPCAGVRRAGEHVIR
jgi:Na+-driven multidrug efflux pump